MIELNMIESVSENEGCSVTSRIEQVKQPSDGYINPKSMTVKVIGKGIEALYPDESISPNLVELAVDHLTRFMLGAYKEHAFSISLMGASEVLENDKAKRRLAGVKKLDAESVINAVKLCGFDACYLASPKQYIHVDKIRPDNATIENIIIMVNRSLDFFESYGPVVLNGFNFEEDGYTDIVSKGDGDFTTKDTLWDLKVSNNPVTKEQTLQLLMHWRMGLRSIHPEFRYIKYLGIYNPRLNTVSRIAVADIPEEVIREVDRDVIGYKE